MVKFIEKLLCQIPIGNHAKQNPSEPLRLGVKFIMIVWQDACAFYPPRPACLQGGFLVLEVLFR